MAPKERRSNALKQRCTALGCLGHLPHEAMRGALGGEILKRTDFVTILRHVSFVAGKELEVSFFFFFFLSIMDGHICVE